jgi:hypothetical protein
MEKKVEFFFTYLNLLKATFCVPCKATNESEKFCPTLFSSQTFDLQALFQDDHVI